MTQPSQNSPAVSIPHVAVINGIAKTTSKAVAEFFGKRHADVIRAINNIDCSPEFTSAHFCVHAETIKAGAVERPSKFYEMTKDGFTFLVMGFTGKEAARFKEAYITRFNEMEAALRGDGQNGKPSPALTHVDLSDEIHRASGGIRRVRCQIFNKLYRRYRVDSYLKIPEAQIANAIQFVRGHELPQVAIQPGSHRPNTLTHDAPDYLSVPEVMQESRDFLFQFMQNVNAAAPNAKIPAIDSEKLAQGLMASLLTNQRFVMSYDHNLRLTLTAINSADRLVNPGNLENMLALVEQAVPEQALADIITACARRMAKVSACRDLKPGR